MSERLTQPAQDRRSSVVGVASSAAGILVTYALLGLGAGWVWYTLWQPSVGVVYQHRWYADAPALRGEFSGTGLFVLVATGCGLVAGAVWAFLGARRPVLTLVLCVAGSLLAAWLMLRLGQSLGPADPAGLAKHADDGTRLPAALKVSGVPPLLTFTLGTLVALGAGFTLFSGKTPEARFDGGPRR